MKKKATNILDLAFYLFPMIVADLVDQDFETYLKNTFYINRPLGAFTITYNPYLEFPLDRIIPTEKDTFFSYGSNSWNGAR